jgi:hypothetical protein
LVDQIPDTVRDAQRELTGSYVPKSRAGTTLLGVHLDGDVAEDFKVIARLQNTTAAKLLGGFVTAYIEQHGTPEQVEKALRSHVRQLGGDRKTSVARALKALAKPGR